VEPQPRPPIPPRFCAVTFIKYGYRSNVNIVEQKSSQSGRRKTITRTFEHELNPSDQARLDKSDLNKHSNKPRLSQKRSSSKLNEPLQRPHSASAFERDFPHVVETVVPKGGLGKTLDATHEFHKRHRIQAHYW
jgi:hypothetical protein